MTKKYYRKKTVSTLNEGTALFHTLPTVTEAHIAASDLLTAGPHQQTQMVYARLTLRLKENTQRQEGEDILITAPSRTHGETSLALGTAWK
jgi:hypothetical protein